MPNRAPAAPASQVLLREAMPAPLERLLPEIDAHADRTFAGWKVPGLVYGVLLDGRLVHARSLGTVRVGEDAAPGLKSVFRIASMTKSFTAATVLHLRDEGRLRLDDPAESVVPELAGLRYPTADSPRITIRHLLTMTAGFPTDDPWGDRQQGLDLRTFSALIRDLSFAWVPGTHFEYSNLGYGILGRVITNVAGGEYRDVVRDRLLGPLGMTSTGYLAEEVPPERLAQGYVWRDDAGFVEEPIDGYGALASMGGVFTTLPDLARWVAGFQDAWPPRDDPEGGHPLARASRREMQQPMVPAIVRLSQPSAEGPPEMEIGAYGFGLFTLDDLRIGRVVAHGGGYPGFGSHMRWHPASGLAVIGMANARYAPVSPLGRDLLAQLVAAEPVARRRVAPAEAARSARDAVEGLLGSWDDAAAARIFAMNVELDEAIERRRAHVDRLRAAHGRLRRDNDLAERSESPFHLEWWLRGERGRVKAEILLSPEAPPRIQALGLTSVPDPSAALAEAAEAVVRALAEPARPEAILAPMLAPSVDRARLARALAASRARCGEVRLGHVLESDGERSATFRLAGVEAEVDLRLALDPESGLVTSIALVPLRLQAIDLE